MSNKTFLDNLFRLGLITFVAGFMAFGDNAILGISLIGAGAGLGYLSYYKGCFSLIEK